MFPEVRDYSSLAAIELYKEYKGVITKKVNSAALNKAREIALLNIADRLNV